MCQKRELKINFFLICSQTINSVKHLRGCEVDERERKTTNKEVSQVPTFTSTLTKQIFLSEPSRVSKPNEDEVHEENKLDEAAGFTNEQTWV